MDGWNGERQIGVNLKEIEPKHVERYEFASKYVNKNDTVLDAACGIGYGSTILAKKAGAVLSVDCSNEAIDYCKKYWNKDNIECMVLNLEDNFKIEEDKKFNVIVSLETVEHLDVNVIDTCKKFYNLLETGGHLIISHPNLQKTPKSLVGEFHKQFEIDGEVTARQFRDMGLEVVEQWYQPHRKAGANPYHVICGRKVK